MEAGASKGAARVMLALPAIALAAVATWEIAVTLRAPAGVPDDDDWGAAMATVRSNLRPGDLIVFAPPWIDPVGRMHAKELLSVDDAARMDAAKYPRIWELSIRGAEAPELADIKSLDVDAVASPGNVQIRRYDQPPVTVLADLRDKLPEATIEGGSARVDLVEVGFAPKKCIVGSPTSDRTPMRITFPALPLGGELVGYVGIADVFTRRDNRTPIGIDVSIGGAVATQATAGVDDGWVRFYVATTPGLSDVTFSLRAQTPGRLICFAAETRK